MSRTITVEGDITAADTRVLLTTQGSVTAPSLVVPAGMTKISKIIVAATADSLADDGMFAFFLRLGGSAVLNGESTIFVGGSGSQTVQSGSDAAPQFTSSFVIDDADILVSPSDTISIAAEGAGVDAGTGYVAVTLVYA